MGLGEIIGVIGAVASILTLFGLSIPPLFKGNLYLHDQNAITPTAYSYFQLSKVTRLPYYYPKKVGRWKIFETIEIIASSLIVLYSVVCLIWISIDTGISSKGTIIGILLFTLTVSLILLVLSSVSLWQLNNKNYSCTKKNASVVLKDASFNRVMNKCLTVLFGMGADIIKFDFLSGTIKAILQNGRIEVETTYACSDREYIVNIICDANLSSVLFDYGNNSKNMRHFIQELLKA